MDTLPAHQQYPEHDQLVKRADDPRQQEICACGHGYLTHVGRCYVRGCNCHHFETEER